MPVPLTFSPTVLSKKRNHNKMLFNRPILSHVICLLAVFQVYSCQSPGIDTNANTEQTDRPNIIVIMADDLGYSDLGCYGGEIATPALDRLAANGLQFTSMYNAARCCPTRASFLTGLYPHQAGIGGMTFDRELPGYRGYLKENTSTIAERLQAGGYQTGMVGKWHVSLTNRRNPDVKPADDQDQLNWLAHQADYGDFSPLETYPVSRGFDKYFGNIWGVVDYFDPFSLVNGKKAVDQVSDDYYHTDAIGDSAVAYVEQFSEEDAPFFLYVAHCAPHWPLQAPEETIRKYENTYKKGWRSIRQARYNRLVEQGLFDPETAPLPPFMFPEQSWATNPDSVWDARAMAVHAAMVDRMDQSIMKLIQKLEELDQLDNTVIFFLSDNGASSERPSRYGPGFDRAGSTRDGETVAFPVDKDVLPGPQTVHAGIGPVWSHTINTPFRFWKAKTFNGGVNTPLIVHWPAVIQSHGIRRESAHVSDLLMTSLDLAGLEYTTTFQGKETTPSPGKSMVPLLTGEGSYQPQASYFWDHMGSSAFRKGKWKIVRLRPDQDWQLFDLEKDVTETTDLSGEHPEIVQKMVAAWNERATELLAYPAPNS